MSDDPTVTEQTDGQRLLIAYGTTWAEACQAASESFARLADALRRANAADSGHDVAYRVSAGQRTTMRDNRTTLL